jgi:hypothetical protein
MDMLGKAYGSRTVDSSGNVVAPGTPGGSVTPAIGRGQDFGGGFWNVSIDKTQYLTDSTIQQYLSYALDTATVLPATTGLLGSNNLYVVFVEDNVAVQDNRKWDSKNGRYDNSVQDFGAYHGAFGGWFYNPILNSWYNTDIHYVVVPYHGGSIPLSSGTVTNAQWSWLSTLDSMTMMASHEIAEAVTDPDINYRTRAWYDYGYGGEAGDVANARTVYLNGYAVQRIADPNDQPMTPAGAAPVTPVSFVLGSNGNLYVGNTGSSLTFIKGGVVSISDQSIDNYGHAMIDVVDNNGFASEYHAGLSSPWIWLDSNVKMAKAGQGVSYILYNDGTVKELKDWGVNAYPAASKPPNSFYGALSTVSTDGAAVAIDAGTDRYGVSMMTVVWSYQPSSYTFGFEVSDSTGWNQVDNGNYTVKTLSAGQMGNIGILYNDGRAVWYNQANGSFTTEGWNVTQFTLGTDEAGGVQFDMLYSGGTVSQYSQADGWRSSTGFNWIGKPHSGWVPDISGTTAYANFFATGQWQWLESGAVAAT